MSAFLKSTILTNRDATPKVLSDSFIDGGRLKETVGSVKAGIDSANSYYRLVQVPSNARVSQIYWQADAVGTSTGGVLDIGVWYPTTIPTGGANFLAAGSSGAIISSSALGGNLTANSAVAPTEVAPTTNIPLQETPLWNILGFSTDPEIDFDIGLVTRVALGVAGYVGLKVRYQL